jgi:hypothetical protein
MLRPAVPRLERAVVEGRSTPHRILIVRRREKEGMPMEKHCVVCGGQLESGSVRARNTDSGVLGRPELGMVVTAFAFVRPGIPTSSNPIKAFAQALREEPDEQLLPLQAYRCTQCGRIELYATQG